MANELETFEPVDDILVVVGNDDVHRWSLSQHPGVAVRNAVLRIYWWLARQGASTRQRAKTCVAPSAPRRKRHEACLGRARPRLCHDPRVLGAGADLSGPADQAPRAAR